MIQLHSDGSLHKESGKRAFGFSVIALHKNQEGITRTLLAAFGEPLMNQAQQQLKRLEYQKALKYLNTHIF